MIMSTTVQPEQDASTLPTDRGAVVYSARQVNAMIACDLLLLRFFRAMAVGKNLYENGQCVTPTIDQALAAVEEISQLLGSPVLQPSR